MKFSLLILLLTVSLSGYKLDSEQIIIYNKIYKLGKTYKTIDNMTIENTLTAIAFRESSLGKDLIGDKKSNGKFNPIEEMSLGVFQVRLETAKEVIRRNKIRRYYYLLNNDSKLISALISNLTLNTTIAAKYFISNYNQAYRRNMWFPYFKAISRHNGGWYNENYYRKVIKDMKSLRIWLK